MTRLDEDGPLDERDDALLQEVRHLAESVDPAPVTLADDIKLRIAATLMHAEAARITEDAALAHRSTTSPPAAISFSSRSVDLLISPSDEPGHTLRLDGWVTPANLRIDVFVDPVGPDVEDGIPTASVLADDFGRFVITGLTRRRVMLVVRFPDSDRSPTVTPIVEF